MTLASGSRLGPYDIIDKLGEGGMGEVFRATDTRLKRQVAIKVLPAAVTGDAERLARFQREAEVLGSLNHPHIAAIHGIEEQDGTRALIMELVEGEDLSTIIARGPMPIEEALPIARQIADALEAAHEQGVVHRDLKPQNIKVRADGTVKVLDFGLAKAADPTTTSGTVANSPTITAQATRAGVILGTAAYMAPEQARGRAVDKRADIWAFGIVVFEMLSGRPAFSGETITDVIAAIVTRDPDWSQLPAGIPSTVRELLERCLEKDAKRRLRDIGDARHALDRPHGAASGTGGVASTISALPATRIGSTRLLASIALASLVLAAALGALWWQGRNEQPVLPNLQLSIAPPAGAQFQIGANSGNVSLSPDGLKVAFVASQAGGRPMLWVRSLAAEDAKPVSGTEGAYSQFWSPDSKRVAFFAAGKLFKVDVAGGIPEVIAEALAGRGGWWCDDDTVLFTPIGGGVIMRVAANGGSPVPVTKLDLARGENAHYWPVALPGGERFIYFVRSAQVENGGIYLGRIDGATPPVRLVPSLSSGIVATRASDGATFLLWARDQELVAQQLDAAASTLRGDVISVAGDVRVETAQRLVYASAARGGVLAWATTRAAQQVFAVYAPDGRRLRELPVTAETLAHPNISPDGPSLAYTAISKGQGDVYIYDFQSGTSRRVSPSDDYDELPFWSGDSASLWWSSSVKGRYVLTSAPREGGALSAAPIRGDYYGGGQKSPSGRFLLYTERSTSSGLDVMAAPVDGGPSVPLLAASGDQQVSMVTNDGRWLFVSDAQSNLLVHRVNDDSGVPVLGPAVPIPLSTSTAVAFGLITKGSPSLVIMAPDGQIDTMPLTIRADQVIVGPRRPLFKVTAANGQFAFTPDGSEFVVVEQPYAATQTFSILTNWQQKLVR